MASSSPCAVGLSLIFVVERLLRIPIAGSIPLFMCGVVIYLFFATSIGIFLATIARTMPQLGLLYMLVAVPLNILSGGNTPLESMPPFLRTIMQASPSTHFVAFAQAILYRGAGFDVVWPQISGGRFDRRGIPWVGSLALPKRCHAIQLIARCLSSRVIGVSLALPRFRGGRKSRRSLPVWARKILSRPCVEIAEFEFFFLYVFRFLHRNVFGLLVLTQAQIYRMAHFVVGRPLREFHFCDVLRLDPRCCRNRISSFSGRASRS